MKIILSRKGFDSSAGGVPSPILPDGRLVSLPIPDTLSTIRYRDIASHDRMTGKLVKDLTRGKFNATTKAHLDPDLLDCSLPREPGWRPLFGQSGAAQGHLRNQKIGIGDVFLFFGLFQRVSKAGRSFQFDTAAQKRHIIFGWLQIGAIEPVSSCSEHVRTWANYHPHFFHPATANNTLYLANSRLELEDRSEDRSKETTAGSGVFDAATDNRTLTAPDATTPSQWQLPAWFYPSRERPPLSYHSNPERWQKQNNHTRLQAASRGQEFVLNCDDYPEALDWLSSLIVEK